MVFERVSAIRRGVGVLLHKLPTCRGPYIASVIGGLVVTALFVTSSPPTTAHAQGDVPMAVQVQGGRPQVPPGAQPGGQPAAQPGQPGQPEGQKPEGDKPATEGEKKEGGESADTVVKRPTKPPRVPDPREFDVVPDKDGRIKFSFNGQPWPAFLQWFAKVAGYNLDWQELPGDYLNLSMPRSFTIQEARDQVNRLLLDRGYTMVLQGQVLSVVKIDKLDPSLLPRVEDEAELHDLPAYDFVKITFQLPDQLKAEQAAADAKLLLSPHAKVQPLVATNRLLVIDAVANLRDVSRIVNAEHAAAIRNVVPNEFVVLHARADHVADQVMILLGLDPASRRTPQELQVEQQRLQLFQQMQQKGTDVAKYLRKDDATVYLAVNQRRNSILANAPPGEMKIIQRTIEMLDVAQDSFVGASGTAVAGAAKGAPYMKKYALITLSPQSVVTSLEEIGDLDPQSRLSIDSDARAVFAFATPGDHQKINAMIDSLDGTGRQFEVIWLRRLPADAVAATIHNLMVGNEDENQNNRRPYYFYYGSRQEEKKPNEGFRVDADTENNRLLLWANDAELKEVNSFLVKLGEIPGESSNPNTVRVHEPRGAEATARLLEQLQRAWRAVGPNELRIEGSPLNPVDGAQPKKEAAEAIDAESDGDAQPPVEADRGITAPRRHSGPTTPVSISSTAGLAHLSLAAVPDDAAGTETPEAHAAPKAETAAAEPGSEPPPITITITPDGRIILSSRDTKALDRLESLFAQIAPAPKNYRVFYLQNASASLVTLNLEEYFEEEDSNSQDGFMRYFYGFSYNNNSDKKGSASLAQRRKIRFIWDPDTNSILVANATPEQLETVASLIDVYDKAPAEDTISARRFKIFRLAYAPADSVAKTIKEVYRDLLSSKDKEFNNGKGGEEKQATSTTTTYYRVYGSEDTDDKKPAKIKASFAGALSVGVDSVSNTVIISAQEEWMASIAEMITVLDAAASPSRMTVGVHKFNTSINGKALHEALARVLGDEAASKIEVTQAGAKPGQEAEGEEANAEGNNKGTPTAE